MKSYRFLTLLGVYIFLFTVFETHAQGDIEINETVKIQGSNQVVKNDVESYTLAIGTGMIITSANWSVSGGAIVSQNQNTITIKWTNLGLGTVIYNGVDMNNEQVRFSLGITIRSTPLPDVDAPTSPIIIEYNCGDATLAFESFPPPGTNWYWQGENPNGTNSKNSNSRFLVKKSGEYFLRARRSDGVWSDTSSSVVVTLGFGMSIGCPELVNLSNENYIYKVVPQKPVKSISELIKNKDVVKSITYFDELGRVKQNIDIKQSANEQDIVTHVEYDNLGRQIEEFLPYVVENYGSINLNARTATQEYYQIHYANDFSGITDVNLINAFSKKEFENSPLNRVLKQAVPGKDWALGNGHEIEFNYQTNIEGEVKLYEVETTKNTNDTRYISVLSGGDVSYQAGELYKTIIRDENHDGTTTKLHTTEEFKNKLGQVVLKRTYALVNSQEEAHDSYYVYDDYGNLTFVLPPKSEANTSLPSLQIIDDLCYQYVYDVRNRLVEKKIPGKGKEYVIYDALDRPVLIQDANLRANDKWLFTKYDALGRVVYTGIYIHATRLNQPEMQLHFTTVNNEASKYYEEKLSNLGSKNIYYSNSNFPSTNTEVLTINYYDNYIFNKINAEDSVVLYKKEGIQSTNRLQGLATGTKIRVLNTDNWITSVTYYDEKARPIHVYSQNEYLETTDIIESDLDFVGRVLETKSTHKKTGKSDVVIIDVFGYDHVGRLISQNQCIGDSALISCSKGAENSNNIFNAPMTLSNNKIITDNSTIVLKPGFSVKALSGKSVVFRIDNGNAETIVENEYDELGQLKSKKVGGSLQEVDYTYNIRGWLKNINEDYKNDNDLFNFSIKYNKPTSGEALYNGNISQTSWNTQSVNSTTNPVLNEYTYTYDALNRITGAKGVTTSNYDVSGISYDKNGNIVTLQRRGNTNTNATSFGLMDNLHYSYYHNKLFEVQDNGNTIFGFKDGTNPDDDYVYDANGNMTIDRNKNITNIQYNHLNLPTTVSFASTSIKEVGYVYDATGVKQRKEVIDEVADIETLTDYAGNYVYENGDLQFFNHSEGYIKKDGNTFNYVYQYKDHLGNVRLSYTDANKDGTITQNEIIEESNYYPFGLKHKGYNNVVSSQGSSSAQKWGYQGQELHDELGLNVNEFKYRFYDPSNGRFWSIDPLAEDFAYNSTYAFAENKLGMGKELEGRELLNNQMLFDVIRLGQQGIQNISNKFSSGAEKTQKAYGEQMRQRVGVPNAEFDSESNRIEMATGIGQISEGATDSAHLAADVAGAIDQTGIVDGVHSLTYLAEGDYTSASLTALGMFGVFEGAKALKYTDEFSSVVNKIDDFAHFSFRNVNKTVPDLEIFGTMISDGKHLTLKTDVIPTDVFMGKIELDAAHSLFKGKNGKQIYQYMNAIKWAAKEGYESLQFIGKRETGVRKGEEQASKIYNLTK